MITLQLCQILQKAMEKKKSQSKALQKTNEKDKKSFSMLF